MLKNGGSLSSCTSDDVSLDSGNQPYLCGVQNGSFQNQSVSCGANGHYNAHHRYTQQTNKHKYNNKKSKCPKWPCAIQKCVKQTPTPSTKILCSILFIIFVSIGYCIIFFIYSIFLVLHLI